MNIFILDTNPTTCAQYHCDKHVVKMILESAQMLSTAHHVLNPSGEINKNLYKATHKNHPCSIWARSSESNYIWLYNLLDELCKEYTHRYGKVHKTSRLLEYLRNTPEGIASEGLTEWAQAMPDDSKRDRAVEAYRNYYMVYKKSFASWKKRERPGWYLQEMNLDGKGIDL